jgi:YVTN family beta-propeller protein
VSKIEAATGRLVSTIGISERNPRAGSGIAYGFEAAWAGEGYAGTVTRIAADTDWGGAEEPIHLYPPDASDTLFVATGAGAVWAASVRRSMIYGVTPPTRRLVARAAVPPTPVGLAVGERVIWVISARPGEKPGALATSGTLARLDPSTAATVSVRPLPFAPSGIAVGFGAVWVSLNTQDSVLRIDPRTSAVEQMIPVGEGPTAVAASDDAIWVVNARSRTISRIDPETDTVVATIPVNGTPSAIASGAGKIWVTGA